MEKGEHAIVVFDGVCNLCTWWVAFIIMHDPGAYFLFVPLQTRKGKQTLNQCGSRPGEIEKKMKTKKRGKRGAPDAGAVPDSVVLVENGTCYSRSTAGLRILRRLTGFWRMFFYLFIIIPAPLRDMVYGFVARNRYRWFGRQQKCMVPQPGYKERFL